jgi:phosphatidylinositol alpha-1,6-mannosyltransferase
MSILLITIDYPPIEGGISTLARQLAEDLARTGEEIVVVAPRVGNESFQSGPGPIRIHRFPFYRAGYLRFFPMSILCARLVLRHGIRKIVAMNVGYGGVFSFLFSKMRPVEYVLFAYGFEFLKFRRSFLVSRIYRDIYRGAEKILAVSRHTAQALAAFGVESKRIEVSYPEIDAAAWEKPRNVDSVARKYGVEGKRLILSASRLIRRKGHRLLLESLPPVFRTVPESICLIAGRGPERPDLIAQAEHLGLKEKILFPGFVPEDDLKALFHLASLFVLTPAAIGATGDEEGFGIVFLEAAACGLPAVAGRTGGVPEAVVENETGLLVSPESRAEVTEAILRLLQDRKLAFTLSEKARKRVSLDFRRGRMAAGILDIFRAGRA